MEQFPDIAGYKIIKEIGSGSMGKVYLALQVSMQREVALKVLSEDFVSDEKFTKRFLEEAKAMGRLRHRNLVSALDAGCADGLYYFVMDYVEGQTLDKILAKRGRLPPQEAFHIAAQVAAGLEFAHQKGLVHRDVKPGNIIVDGDGVAKLCDMGLVRPKGAKGGAALEGTPNYISPEQAAGKAQIDHRSDIYSLGATLYRMVSGRPPFEGKTAYEIARKHITQTPKPLREIAPDVPAEFAAVIEKMMAKRLQDRYQSMAEARRDMERVMRGETPSVLKPSPIATLLRTKHGLAALGGAIVVLLLLLLFVGGGSPPKKQKQNKEKKPPWMAKNSPTKKPSQTPPEQTTPNEPNRQEEQRQKEEKLLAEAEKETRELVERLAKPEDLEELKVRLEALAARYAGTLAEGYIKKRIERVEQMIKRRDAVRAAREVLQKVDALLKDGKFAEAMRTLESGKPVRGLEAKFGAARERIVQENRREAEWLKEKVQKLLKAGEAEEADNLINDFLCRSLERFKASAERLKRLVEKAKEGKQEKEVLTQLWGKFVSLLKGHKYEEAEKFLDDAAGKVVSRRGMRDIERCRDILRGVVETIKRIREALLAARGQVVQYPLYGGGRIYGRIVGVGADGVVFEVKKGTTVEKMRVSLWDIDFSELLSISGGIEGRYWWEAGLFLWHIGHPEQALSFMRKAVSLKYRVDRALLSEVTEAERAWWIAEAQRIASRIEDLLKAGDADNAAKLLGDALGNKRLAKVKAWLSRREQLKSAVRDALIQKFLAKGIEGLINGRLKRKKNGLVEIEYHFSRKEEYSDFVPVGKGQMRSAAGGTLVSGVLLHRVVFDGDVEVEIRAAPLKSRPANVGIILKRGAEGAYLGGVGLKPVQHARIRFKAPYRTPRAPRVVPLPANMIVRLNRNLASPELMAYSLRPSVSRRAYTIKFAHKDDTLTLSVSGRKICYVKEKVKNDAVGCVGLWSGDGTFKIYSMTIEGRPDKGWLESLAASFVEKKYSFLKIRRPKRKK